MLKKRRRALKPASRSSTTGSGKNRLASLHSAAIPQYERFLYLQRTIGNQAFNRMLATGKFETQASQPANQVQRQDDWDPRYKEPRARAGNLPYEKYKASIGNPGEAEGYAPA